MRRGSDSPQYVRDRRRLQRHKRRYMELREELMLAGEIHVEPSGAVRDERVDPADQTAQALPALTAQAIRNGWAVPEEKKPKLVDELIEILDDPEEATKVKVAAFQALRQADQHQFERDHPEKANQSGPLLLNVNVVEVQVDGNSGKQNHPGIPEATQIPRE